MGIRIAVVGAGSRTFGPSLVRDVCLSEAGVELARED